MYHWFFLLIVILLFALAVSDLIVGVSNDAVNFLNSAVGSKAASFRVIMIVAALGVFIGVTFSSGLMEIARKGIFHPEKFYFDEIMILFLAVMMTDIILLDLFNTFGLPTSTTVSIVFELLGAAVAVSLIKITHNGDSWSTLSTYINGKSAIKIITGIFVSVLIAFTVGGIIQYLVRMVFSFELEKTQKYFGSVWGGIAIAAITYFILIKGARGSAILSDTAVDWIMGHTAWILLLSFAGWTLIMQALHNIFGTNILKFTVLAGTFALALAFASNDLVNFIGVPLAGFASYNLYGASHSADPSGFAMSSLGGSVEISKIFLLAAGGVMVLTLFFSRKARSVIATTVNLSRQVEGYERFSSNWLARGIVRLSIAVSGVFGKLVPGKVSKRIGRRFDTKHYQENQTAQGISFDLLRASVNLIVASALIALGTSLKLPLSTTYVTFMVAMGTSLADGAWGRESAVFRISGVITVIGGWLFTALSAFTAAFCIALFIDWGGLPAIGVLIVLALFFIIRTHSIHRRRGNKEEEATAAGSGHVSVKSEQIINACNKDVYGTLSDVLDLYLNSLDGFMSFNRKKLKKAKKRLKEIDKSTGRYKDDMYRTIIRLSEEDIPAGQYYVQVLDYLQETVYSLDHIVRPLFEYIDNNHSPLIEEQQNEIGTFSQSVREFFDKVLGYLREADSGKPDKILAIQKDLIKRIGEMNKKQLQRIKHKAVGTKNGIIYLNTLTETKNLMHFLGNMLGSRKEFADLMQHR